MNKPIIIFDLYNTLIYTKKVLNPYLNLFNDLNFTDKEKSYWKNIILTKNFNSLSELLLQINTRISIDIDRYENQILLENSNTVVYDDTYSVLEFLSKKYEIQLLSNISTPYKECFYKLNLDKWIKNPTFSCDIGYKKPQIESFNYVLNKCKSKSSKKTWSCKKNTVNLNKNGEIF